MLNLCNNTAGVTGDSCHNSCHNVCE